MDFEYQWTDGNNAFFQYFYLITEEYYSAIVGGKENRKAFIPYNCSAAVDDVLLVFIDGIPVACSGLKHYSDKEAEIKRVWVEPDYRGMHIATKMMEYLEAKAAESGYERLILQTRELMKNAVSLYTQLGYRRIENYPPYDKLDGAICMAKAL